LATRTGEVGSRASPVLTVAVTEVTVVTVFSAVLWPAQPV